MSDEGRPAPGRSSRSTVGVVAMTRGFVMVVVAGILIGEVAFAEEDVPNVKDPKMIAAGHDLFLAKGLLRNNLVTFLGASVSALWCSSIPHESHEETC